MENRYNICRQIGAGAFGKVYLATVKKQNDQLRAIKRLRGNFTWDNMYHMREVQSIIHTPPHPNIVQLYEIHRDHNGVISFIFEYMPGGTLLEMIENRIEKKLGALSHGEIRELAHQILLGVQHLHINGIYHRDLKPENILLGPNNVCKVADFSLARHDDEIIDLHHPLTSYISTRWYRAPELLLHSKTYSNRVDMWAVGCIIAELYTFLPLFPGRDEVDQLRLIFKALGTPTMANWGEGNALLNNFNLQSWEQGVGCSDSIDPHDFIHKKLREREPYSNKGWSESYQQDETKAAEVLLLSLLVLNPVRRSCAKTALNHKYFSNASSMDSTTTCKATSDSPMMSEIRSLPRYHNKVVVSPLPDNCIKNYSRPFNNQNMRNRNDAIIKVQGSSAIAGSFNPYLHKK